MKSLKIETPIYDKIKKAFTIVYSITMILVTIYLFILVLSPVDVITFRTFAIITITLLIGLVIPYSSYRILDNAQKTDNNNALKKYSENLTKKYNVNFQNKNSPKINQACVFVNNDTGEKFWGIATVDVNGITPLLKTFNDYEE